MLASKKSAHKRVVGGRLPNVQIRQNSEAILSSSSMLFCPISGSCSGCDGFRDLNKRVCPQCRFEGGGMVRLRARGRLESFTIIRQSLPGYKGPMPYAIGAITLPEGIRLRAVVSGCHPEELQAGMEVELGLVKLCEDSLGRDVVVQAFQPV